MALFRHLRGLRSLPRNTRSSVLCALTESNFKYLAGRTAYYSQHVPDLPPLDLLQKYEYILTHMQSGNGTSTDRLRVILYPDTDDYFLKELHSVTTVQQVFDVMDAIPVGEMSPRHSAQALVSLWDMQKLILTYDPQSTESSTSIDSSAYPISFVRTLTEHPKYLAIRQHVLHSYKELDEIALGAILVVLQKLLHRPRDRECQILIEEMLARKNNLSWPTLSRFATFFKSRNDTYAKLVQIELLPRIYELLNTMKSDEDIRCASICMRFCRTIVSKAIVTRYQNRLEQIHEKNICSSDDPVTYCKIILALLATSHIEDGRNQIQKLLNRYCKALQPKLGEIRNLDLLYLSIEVSRQKEGSSEFIEAVSDHVNRLAETCPHPFVISCILPRTTQQRSRLNQYLKDLMAEGPKNFRAIAWNLYRVLQNSCIDPETWHLYWTRATKYSLDFTYNPRFREELNFRNRIGGSKLLLTEDELSEEEDPVDTNDEENLPFKAVIAGRWARAYTSTLMLYQGKLYHEDFERHLAEPIVEMLKGYKLIPYKLAPNDYIKLLGFLVAIRWADWQELVIPGMIQNADARELHALSRAIYLSTMYRGVNDNRSYQAQVSVLADLVIKTVENFWQYPASYLSTNQCIHLSNVALNYHTMYRTNPIVAGGFQSLMSREWNVNYANMAVMMFCNLGGIHSQEAFQRVSDFLCENADYGNADVATIFTTATFRCASEKLEGHEVAAKIIERHCDQIPLVSLLHALIGLSYHRCLPVSLVNKIFSVDFIDGLDEFLRNQYKRYLTERARSYFMQLNRAVCIDMPEANVPWFHETYCRDYSEMAFIRKSHIHSELKSLLRDIYGYGYTIEENKYSPYYYFIDFLIEPVNDFGTRRPSQTLEKVAVLIRRPDDYTVYTKRLKGHIELAARHLEILGYKVINIDPYVWNSMHMSEKSAKRNFLLAQINATN